MTSPEPPEGLEHSHAADDIAERLSDGPQASYLRDWVLGGIDGAVTTLAIVAGVAGAELSTAVILILGVANLLADGFSMAAANYSGVKAERDDYERLRQMELRHIALAPEGEREEVRQIFAAKGFEGADLERAVDVITSSRERWVRLMLEEEHGAPRVVRSGLIAGAVTFAAFIVCGMAPLIPYILGPLVFGAGQNAFMLACIMTCAIFFGIGSLKSKWSTAPWWRSGLETLAIGAIAASAAYIAGAALKGLTGA